MTTYSSYKSSARLPPIPQSPNNEDNEEETFDDAHSVISNSSWKSDNKLSTASSSGDASLNNNHTQTRPTTDLTTIYHHHHSTCHKHGTGHHTCSCLTNVYEDDEVCRKNYEGHLDFGIVAKFGTSKNLKIFWTLGNTIEEQDIGSLIDEEDNQNLRLIDRKAVPGDIIHVNKKRGDVIEVHWTCHVQVLENNVSLLHIPCEKLEPLVPHYPGQKLEYSGWVGTITNVNLEATLMFTGARRTGVVDCSALPMNQQPYPGRKVRYTVDQYVEAKLRFLDDNRTVAQVFAGYLVVDAFVLFLNVTDVQVKWNGHIKPSSGSGMSLGKSPKPSWSSIQPPTTLSKSHLKKHAKVLGTIQDVDWESCHDAVEKYFLYTAADTDQVVPDGAIEEYMMSRYFDGEKSPACLTVKEYREQGNKICTNVAYNVKVIRFLRMLKVRWNLSGKVEEIPASTITCKRSFHQPYLQLVQRKVSLSPYTYDEFGVSLSPDANDTVLVQWVGKMLEKSTPPYKFTFNPTYQTHEPVFNIEPHFAYGTIAPRQIVFRSMYCRVPEALFTLGWVRRVNPDGTVKVISAHTGHEHAVSPLEIEVTGIEVEEVSEPSSQSKLTRYTDLVQIHGLEVLRKADKIFTQNLTIITDSTCVPDHFSLLPKCPNTHTFYKTVFSVKSDGTWMRAVKKDQLFLTTRMNEEIGSIWIKGFRDRLDLFSVLMAAPPNTPYEGGLFSLDLQLIPEYPCSPPAIYLLTSAGPLLPGTQNLELNDNVMPPHTLVDSLTALQSKLFSSSDSFDVPSSAASLQRRNVFTKDSEDRLTNAHIITDVLDLTFRNVMDPPKLWSTEILTYFHMTFDRTKERLLSLLDVTNPYSNSSDDWIMPAFPLLPVSDGFADSVLCRIKRFEELVEKSSLAN